MNSRYLGTLFNLFYILVLFFAGTTAVYAQEQVPGNDGILLRLCLSRLNDSVLIDTLSQPVYPSGNLTEHHKYELVQFFLKKNKKVRTTDKHTAVLKLTLLTNNTYKKLTKKYGLRRLDGFLTATLIDSIGTIEEEQRYKIAYEDTIPAKNYTMVTNSWSQTEFQHKPRKSHFFNRVVQPALLLSSIGVTIFLLFNVRGK